MLRTLEYRPKAEVHAGSSTLDSVIAIGSGNLESYQKQDQLSADRSNGPLLSGSSGDNEASSITCMGLSLARFSPLARFLLLCCGIFVFYILYGYFQELIFRLDGMKPFGWYLTLVQFKLYSVFGFVESRLRGDTRRRIPWRIYLILAFLTVSTMGLSNTSVAYLNYPTQVMFKCCKLIPVLIGSVLIQKKKITIFDFLAAVFMSLGLIFFTLADAEVSPDYDSTGIILILSALVADAAIGNVQEKYMKFYKASNTEVVFYSYSVGFVYIFGYLLVAGSLHEAFLFCAQHPLETYGYFTIFSLTGYFGIQMVLDLIKSSGAFVAVTVTTCRKAVTIILSFVFFTKPFTSQYIWSGLLVLIGIYLNVCSKRRPKWMSLVTPSALLRVIRLNLSRRRYQFTPTTTPLEV